MNNHLADKLRLSLTHQHIGLCIFSEKKFFKESSFAKYINYLLDWNINYADSDLPHHLLLPNLYNRTFPIVLWEKKLSAGDSEMLQKKLEKFKSLLQGLVQRQAKPNAPLSNFKALVILDQDLSDAAEEKLKKIIKNTHFTIGLDVHKNDLRTLNFELFT